MAGTRTKIRPSRTGRMPKWTTRKRRRHRVRARTESTQAKQKRAAFAALFLAAENRRLLRGVLELLQRTHLHLGGGRLGGEPLFFLGEGVDALALRLGRNVDGGDLQQARQREGTGALLADGTRDGAFQRSEHGAHVTRGDAAVLGQV